MYPRIILFILFPLFGFSQAPQKINFQSILRNTNGEVVSNKLVSLKISILSGSISGLTVYSETHTKTTDPSGLISLQIGNGTVLSGIFADIAWGSAAHFIKLEADFSGGNNFVLLGTQELMSVPYAFHSNTADSLVGGANLKVIKDELTNLRRQMDTSSINLVSRLDDLQNQIKQIMNNPALSNNVFDIDGNSYKTVKIGSQIWMSENLKTSRYRNGGPIPNVFGNADWQALTSGAWSYYNHDAAHDFIYGKLYNGYTTLGDTLCPTGWSVPTDAEWSILTTYLGGQDVAGGKMKSVGTAYWNSPNMGATNDSGFSALPGGFRDNYGFFINISSYSYFWSTTGISDDLAWYRGLYKQGSHFIRFISGLSDGFSVRCLRD